MSRASSLVQTGLVDAGPLRGDFRRFLELLGELGPGVVFREEPFRIVVELDGRLLCDCRPKAHAVHVTLGLGTGGAVRCQTYEDFADILGSLLSRLRAGLPGAGTPLAPA